MAQKRDVDHAFDINKLNMWFALSSIVMFIFFVWIMWQDFSKDWKHYQAKFRKLDKAKTLAAQSEEIENLSNNPEYIRFLEELEAAGQEKQQQEADYQKALKEQASIQGEWYRKDQSYRFMKAEFEAKRYDYEEIVAKHSEEVAEAKTKLDETANKMKLLLGELDEVNSRKAKIDANAERFTSRIAELEKEMTKITSKLERLRRKEAGMQATPANIFRNLPMVDFINPSIKIQQVVVNNQYEDLNFTVVPRVDRCMTCHVPIDQPGYEEGTEIPGYGKIEQPFVSHPNLKLYAAGDSKHPMDRFGCTGCHSGRGRSADFIGVVHVPEDENQKKQWEEKYHWHKMHHWDTPMYETSMVEASCIKCHQDVAQIPEGKKINVARGLFAEYGCHGCHQTKGFETLPKVGPDLRYISSKVTKEWTFRWVRNPKAFRPTTRMPRYFHNSNNSSSDDIDRSAVEIRSMVEFLFSRSKSIEYAPVTLTGDAESGKILVREIGCVGCHLTSGEKPAVVNTRRRFGPALDKLGSKTNAVWLFNWLKEPRHYAPSTRMPNMRLTDQEAMNIATYLLSLRDPDWEQKNPVPQFEKDKKYELYLKQEIVHYLKRTHGLAAESEYNKMSDEQRWLFLGEKTIQRYGCTGCHLIDGYENAKGIGTSLSEEGSKKLSKFDFGFVQIEHSVQAWISQKLHDPRSFDKDRVRQWDEKLMMPNFEFNDEEAQALTMLILGLTKEKVPAEAQDVLTAREQVAEKGRRLVMEKNCVACHNIDGWGGEIATVITEPGTAPPALIAEGEKVHADWLFQFLKSPGNIRPWLKIRMPNFMLSDEEANTLVQYFMASANVGPFNTPPDIAENLVEGELVFTTFRCTVCHVLGDQIPEGRTPADLAPDLTMAKTRLRPDWIPKWLNDPQKLLPGTRMPDFFPEAALPGVLNGDPDKQIQAIRNYLYSIGRGNQDSIAAPE